jgi:hypothetical protein
VHLVEPAGRRVKKLVVLNPPRSNTNLRTTFAEQLQRSDKVCLTPCCPPQLGMIQHFVLWVRNVDFCGNDFWLWLKSPTASLFEPKVLCKFGLAGHFVHKKAGIVNLLSGALTQISSVQ